MRCELHMGKGGPDAPLVVVVAGEDGQGKDPDPAAAPGCQVLVARVDDWYAKLSPWEAPSAWPRDPRVPAFAGHGGRTLQDLLAAVAQTEAAQGLMPSARGICGYSLAGLFSTYAHVSQPDVFVASASGSGSFWFDGWRAWLDRELVDADMAEHLFAFSLGSKESHVRNPTMAKVKEGTEDTIAALAAHHALTLFSPEPGGHFTDVAGRQERLLGRLAAWLVEWAARTQ